MSATSPARTLNALVVGLGRMGTFHARVLRDLGYEVTTVDPDPEARADHWTLAGVRTGVPAGRYFDVACIAVPIPLLTKTAAHVAIRFHVTHMLVEKPFASSTMEAIKYLPALHHVPHVAVGYVERFNPAVRQLRAHLEEHGPALGATFIRWNARPTMSVGLDLQSHDLDLAHSLSIPPCSTHYCTRAGTGTVRREISVTFTSLATVHADLTAHSTSPLHAQWHAFLSGRPGYATPDDAMRVLHALEGQHDQTEPTEVAA